MISRARPHLIGLLVLSLVACSDDDPIGGIPRTARVALNRVKDCDGPATSLPPNIAATLPPRTGSMVPDDQWADLASRVPGGFAGVIYDGGRPVLFLTDPSKAAAAKEALAPSFPSFDIARAEVRRARWDFAQLVDWYNHLNGVAGIWSIDGISSGDKDESANRITYGVVDSAAANRLLDVLARLDIPCDLIRVEIIGRIVPAD